MDNLFVIMINMVFVIDTRTGLARIYIITGKLLILCGKLLILDLD